MTLQERKDIIDKLSKIADIVNKKLIVLSAIGFAAGTDAIKLAASF
jgi:hypothetical protein